LSFKDATAHPGSTTSYDGLGRVKESVSNDVVTSPQYGRAGAADSVEVSPGKAEEFPGEKVTAVAPQDLTGAPVVKTLTPGQSTQAARSGLTVIRDDAGRVTEKRRPDGAGKTTYTYTPGGRVASSVSPGGITTAYTYDKTGQVTEVTTTSADGKTAEKTGYSYDPYTGAVTAVYDPDDKAGTTISYTYDADGNITEASYPDGKTIRQEFSNGQLTRTTDAAGLTTTYTYNSDGTVAEAVQRDGNTEDSPVKAEIAYTYDGLGRITKVDRGNGVSTEVQFTDADQIKHEKTTRDGALVSEASYLYDSHNNVTERSETRPAAEAGGAAGAAVKTTTRYTYDAYNRLLSSQVSGADGKELASSRYELNVSSDVIRTETTSSADGQDSRPTVTEHGIDTAGRLNTLTVDGREHAQTFDGDGNLLTDHRGNTYTYNTRSQPVSMTSPGGKTTRYAYWADGRRATSTETGGEGQQAQELTTRFYYTPDGTLINDTHTQGDTTSAASYLMAGTRQARTLTGDSAKEAAATGEGYLIQDRHGNTTALTSSSGETVQAWNYTDYGQHADHTGAPAATAGPHPSGAARNPFTYAGEYTNPDGTQYLKARTVDPATGRFTTPDTALQHNLYQAFGANPVTNIDPEGTTEIPDWGGWTVMGITLAAAAITAAALIVTVATGGAFSIGLGIALAGAALDLASSSLEAAAMSTGRTQIDDPLNIAALTFGAAGLALGIGTGAVKAVSKMAKRFAKKAPAAIPADTAVPEAKTWEPITDGQSVEEWAKKSPPIDSDILSSIESKYAYDQDPDSFKMGLNGPKIEWELYPVHDPNSPPVKGPRRIDFEPDNDAHEVLQQSIRDTITLEAARLTMIKGVDVPTLQMRAEAIVSIGQRMDSIAELATRTLLQIPGNTLEMYKPAIYWENTTPLFTDLFFNPRNGYRL
ncbi:RHS repeat-associated core domain-containing protein, partial [Streptomyces sp. NPDC008121]|uniref:RHS repeat-associated core domain-containing protein n=1 Tax=Streptomyces sp. NPDC008121 TaxID=3364809 RepID=UPI0036ECA08B